DFSPSMRSPPSTRCMGSGSGILTLSLPKKPFSTPSLAMAAADPWVSASFKPETASRLLRLARSRPHAEALSNNGSANEIALFIDFHLPGHRPCTRTGVLTPAHPIDRLGRIGAWTP